MTLATDPPVSEAQRRAMWAAAEGSSTLGIPKKVGKEFVGKDMKRSEFGSLLRGLINFFVEESEEPEHAEDGGKLLKTEVDYSRGKDDETCSRCEHYADGRCEIVVGAIDPGYWCEKFQPRGAADDLTANASIPSAGVAVMDPHKRVLLVRRSAKGDHAGEWCLPGGRAEGEELPEDTARRELEEETGYKGGALAKLHSAISDEGVNYHTFVNRSDSSFRPQINDEHDGYVWAPLDRLPKPLHPGVAKLFGADASSTELSKRIAREIDRGHDPKQAAAIAYAELGEAHDAALAFDWAGAAALVTRGDRSLAFDRATERVYDRDGRLHLGSSHISKSNVCEYLGREIPGADSLGLDPERKYKLWRHPDELKKGADTFNRVPILSKHVPTDVDNFPADLIIGATGSDASFGDGYLDNSLVFWTRDALDGIEDESQKELSSAYHYTADMTPGRTPDGEDYDGIMRNIVGNHVALVRQGRAGPDVVVGDSALQTTTGENGDIMAKQVTLSPTALTAKGALLTWLRPRLAQDAQIDLESILSGVNAANFKASKPKIAADVKAAFKPKLAKDASIDDVDKVLDLLREEKEESAHGLDDEPTAFLKGKLSSEDWKTYDGLMTKARDAKGHDETPEEKEAREKKEREAKDAANGGPPDFPGKPEVGKGVDKKAMDAAIAAAVSGATQTATQAAMKLQRDIRAAERAVRPYVGELAMDHDDAAGVYRTALKMLNVKDVETIHESALPAVLAAQPQPGKRPASAILATDAANDDDFYKRFPGAKRLANG